MQERVQVSRWAELRAERALFEDDGVLVLDKPAGIAVVGGRGELDLVGLARAAGEALYPAHRLDKVTSGAVLLAKTPRAHAALTRQFHRRMVGKVYLALVRSRGLPKQGTVELPLSVGRKNRVRVAAPRASIVADRARGYWSVPPGAAFTHVRVYPSLTVFTKVWEGEERTLLAVRPVTGRRHQIRVHLAWIGHPIEGDPLFARAGAPAAPRAGLHAWQVAFTAPWSGGARVRVEAPPGADFWAPLAAAEVEAVQAALSRMTA